ncbi:MAG TPA: GntR family transcriptional regulator [Candidatus Limnocylindrales bacterium]|nr:GntR family transcriptional regulator [Candidatus Limnocylindrales bacterium]
MARTASSSKIRFQFRLDLQSGVPVYRQLIDQVKAAIASGLLQAGDQLPTIRQLAVDLAINLNTVLRAYRELELGGFLETQQGTGTFITQKKVKRDETERARQLAQIAGEFLARAAEAGFTAEELAQALREHAPEPARRR